MPLVSVIIPAYNCERTIKRALTSISCQTLNDFEAVIVNDGSTDNTASVVRKFIENDQRFRLLARQNKGVGAARNAGLDAASGKYIAFVDSDDTVKPDMLSKMCGIAEKYDLQAVACGYLMNIISANGSLKTKTVSYKDSVLCSRNEIRDIFYVLFKKNLTGVVWNKLVRKDYIKAHRLRFQELFNGEDRLFNLDMFLRLERFGLVSDCLYNYEFMRRSLTNRFNSKKFESMAAYYRALNKLYKDWGISNEAYGAEFSYIFIQGVLSCFASSFDKSCEMKIRERYQYFKAALNHPEVIRASRHCSRESLISRGLAALIRTRNVPAAMVCSRAAFWLMMAAPYVMDRLRSSGEYSGESI